MPCIAKITRDPSLIPFSDSIAGISSAQVNVDFPTDARALTFFPRASALNARARGPSLMFYAEEYLFDIVGANCRG